MQRKAAMFSSASQNWETPLWLYEHIKQMRGIANYDTDPATNENNPLGCEHYYTKEDNGLERDWRGTCFINPPFGRALYQGKQVYLTGLWIEEAWLRTQTDKNPDVSLVTMLIPARTDTIAFHKYIYDIEKCETRPNIRLQFLKGRLRFGDARETAPFASCVVDFYRCRR